MPKEYSKEQLWKLYEKLPVELKEAIFSAETADDIHDICTRNGIEDDRISEVAKSAGQVLLGILPPDDFQNALEKEVKLKKEVAKKVSQEINRFVFFPVKESLTGLYKMEIAPPARPAAKAPALEEFKPEMTLPKTTVAEPGAEEEKPKPKEQDVYRETIE